MMELEKQWEIVKCGTGGYREYRIPGILPAKDGLLLACEARAEDMGDWGKIDILVMRMAAGEAAGADPKPKTVLKLGGSEGISGSRDTYHNPVLVPDGENIHLIYHKNYEQAFVITSTDGGDTWSKDREITDTFRQFAVTWNVCASGPGHGLQMKNGRLVAPVWLANGRYSEDGQRREHSPSSAGCIYSDDHGVTWKAGFLAGIMEDGNETSVAEGADGRLLFNFRNRNGDYCRVLGISADGGETLSHIWSSQALFDPRCFGGMTSVGEEIWFVNCDSKEKRVNVTVKRSRDMGDHWETMWRAGDVGGYADIGIVDGRVYVFYEQQARESKMIEKLILKMGSARKGI